MIYCPIYKKVEWPVVNDFAFAGCFDVFRYHLQRVCGGLQYGKL